MPAPTNLEQYTPEQLKQLTQYLEAAVWQLMSHEYQRTIPLDHFAITMTALYKKVLTGEINVEDMFIDDETGEHV